MRHSDQMFVCAEWSLCSPENGVSPAGTKDVRDGMQCLWTLACAIAAAADVYQADDHGPRLPIFALASEHTHSSCIEQSDLAQMKTVYPVGTTNPKGLDSAKAVFDTHPLAQDISRDTSP